MLPVQEKTEERSGARRRGAGAVCVSILLFAAETLLFAALAALLAAYLICRGPSPRAAARFAEEAERHPALAPLAAYLLVEQSAEGAPELPAAAPQTLAPAPAESAPDAAPSKEADSVGGIVVERILGRGYSGYLMTVLDPSRVILGCDPAMIDRKADSVEGYVRLCDGIAGINAGGFYDPQGAGNGAIPEGLVVFEGTVYRPKRGVKNGFVGLDGEHRLRVGLKSAEEIEAAGIEYGACFGPTLIENGVIADGEIAAAGSIAVDLHPRTAIGQRDDGAILLLIIEGRQVASMGASCRDLAELLLAHGAVVACNLDGGRSTAMWYDGAYLRSPSAPQGRMVPNAFVVLREEAP